MAGKETYENVVGTTIEAFKYEPADVAGGEVFAQESNPAVMLFDHALLSTTMGKNNDIPFTVGNLMALSAPGKGLKKNTTKNPSELAKNVNKHGPALTQEFIKIVKKIVKQHLKDNKEAKEWGENLSADDVTDQNLLNNDIKLIKAAWVMSEEKMFFNTDAETFGRDLKDALIAQGGDNSEEDSLITKVWKKIANEKQTKEFEDEKALQTKIFEKISKPNSTTIVKYHALQALGHNAIWDAQNLGGFNVGENSLYKPLQSEKLGENGQVPPLVEDFVKKSIPPKGILFLCESALLFGDKGEGKTFTTPATDEINHLRVCKDKEKYEKVYSASWNDNAITITEAEINNLHDPVHYAQPRGDSIKITEEDYCVFKVTKGGTDTFVVVVHVNDKVAKKGEKKHWNNFLKNCIENGISYVAGDTNVTFSKTGSSTSDYKPFTGEYVTERSITNFNIKKGRVPGNILANNQIYKFEVTNEKDGMGIFKLKEKVESIEGEEDDEKEGVGGRKRRKRTKKRRKSRKTKRKRKRKRTKKRKRKRRKGTKKRKRKR